MARSRCGARTGYSGSRFAEGSSRSWTIGYASWPNTYKESLMHRNLCGSILAIALLAGTAGTSVAQETGTPIFKAPYRAFTSHELGASLSDPGEGVSLALEGFYRYGSGANDFSVRGGFADLNGSGGTRVLLGGDFRTQVVSYSESFPLDGSLTLGLGANVGDGRDKYYVPVGISLGRRFELEGSNTIFV